MNRLKSFNFVENINSYQLSDAFLAKVPANISGRDNLLGMLFNILQLPGYFGFNWDALYDCLRDFHWISQKYIVLLHEDLPDLDDRELSIYLKILSESSSGWKEDEEHSLKIVFPESSKRKIEQLLELGII